jgi:O-acetyl-ADP-ribose deacetylase
MSERLLLVIGYSGSDPSIMNALAEGLSASSDGPEVLWLLYKDEEPGPLLLKLEQQFGTRVHIASLPGYQEFWTVASRRILDRSPLVRYDSRIVASYFVGRTEVTVPRGDITEVGVEAIVSSDDCSLTHAGGVSRAIAEAAGDALDSDLAQFAPLLPLSPGEVIVTGAGRLADRGVRYVIHAAISREWQIPARAEDARACTSRVMKEAEAREIRTLAIPALGGGQGGLDADEVASAVVGGVIGHLQRDSHLKQLVLVLNSEKAVEAERQMDTIKQRQEERLRQTLSELDPDLALLGQAMLDQENWGINHGDLLSTWLREMAARGGDPAGQAVRYCHARWHTQLCRMLARLENEPDLAEQVDQQRRQVQALEIAYAAAFQ